MKTINEDKAPCLLVAEQPKRSQAVAVYGAHTVAATLDSMLKSPYLDYLTTLSKGSIATARSSLSKVSRILYDMEPENAPWERMTSYHYNFMIKQLKGMGLAPKTVHRHASMVKAVLTRALLLEMIPAECMGDYSAIMGAKGVKGSQGRGEIKPHRSMSSDEINKLFATIGADKSPMGLRDMAIISIMRGCGFRRMEVADMEISHIRWAEGRHGELLVKQGKGDKTRVVPMPPGLRDILLRWMEIRGDELGPLFCSVNRGGKLVKYSEADKDKKRIPPALVDTYRPLDRSSINRLMEKRLFEAELNKATPHDLRYTFAQKSLDNSDMQTVADLMGHSNISTTSIYTQASKEKMRAVIDMDDVFLSGKGDL